MNDAARNIINVKLYEEPAQHPRIIDSMPDQSRSETSVHMKFSNLKIPLRTALIIGFTIVLGLMILIIIIAVVRMDNINRDLETVVNQHVVKVELAHSMETALRERAIVMHTIAALNDPFVKDEYWIKFNELGNEFVTYRDKLWILSLSDSEKALLQQIRLLTSEAQPFVVSVVDKALTATSNTDTLALLESIRNEAVPRQMQIANLLSKLISGQKDTMDEVVKNANVSYDHAVYIMSLSSTLAVLIGLVVAIYSVSNATKYAATLHRMAMFDNLTKLPNRVLFQDRLTQAIARSRRDGLKFAILSIDLNGFKYVNDSLGHHHGDTLLALVAERFMNNVRESDTVSRLGGDEFSVLLHNTDRDRAETIARNLVDLLKEPFMLSGHSIVVGLSIGISVYPEHGQEIDQLVQRADEAMYVAKRTGTGFQYYAEARGAP